MKKIEAVIFDWAGTTVDYGCFAPVQAFVEAFKAYGITPTMEEVRKPMGMLKIDHIRTMMSMERIDKLWKENHHRNWAEEDVQDIYQIMEKKTLEILPRFADVKPHVVHTIKELRERGIKIGSTTGYTDEMMNIVAPAAKQNGYEPDLWVSPNSVGNIGRPYPYMIFKNIEMLGVSSVKKVIKVGDTVADIKEGKNAGVLSVGVIEGSSVMGLTKEEYDDLTPAERMAECKRVAEVYKEAGADYVIKDVSGLLEL